MSNRKIRIAAIVTIICVVGSFLTIYAQDNAPGSVSDPIATKSYVDAQIEKVVNLFTELAGNGNNTGDNKDNNTEPSTNAMTFKVLGPLPGGTIILGGEGTEMIVRSGGAIAVCPGINGIQNVTAGDDIPNEAQIPLNHLVIIPREDGRGIYIEKEAYVMIRGDYTVE